MSLYNMLFGTNEIAPALLFILDIDQPDEKWNNCHFSIFSSRDNADEWERGLRETNEIKEESK